MSVLEHSLSEGLAAGCGFRRVWRVIVVKCMYALRTFLVLPVFLTARVVAADQPAWLRLSGSTTYRSFDWTGSSAILEHYDEFVLELGDTGAWHMVTRSTIDTDGYFVTAFDTTNLYTIHYSTRRLKDRKSAELADPVPVAKANHSATVSTGAYPLDLLPPQRFTWFALASAAYLADPESAYMPALWRDPRIDLLAYAFVMQADYASPSSTILTQAVFYTAVLREPEPAGLLSPTSRDMYVDRSEQLRIVRSLRVGQLAARYTVQDSTNFGGAPIPLSYKLEVYWAGRGIDTTNQTLAEVFAGQVTNFAVVPRAAASPAIIGTLTVRDFRFRYRDAKNALDELRYKINDRKWKSTNDVSLQEGFAQLKVRSPRYENTRSTIVKRGVLLLLLGLVLALPLVLRRLTRVAQ